MSQSDTIYGYAKPIHDMAEVIIDNEILSCQSSLVNEALSKGLFDHDSIVNPYDTEGEHQEIFQWFLISQWLADKLQEIHEPILDNEYGTWWGRTCYGQSIILDGTIQKAVIHYQQE